MMLAGVTLIAPETVFFAYDTEIGADTVIEPNVFFGPGVTVGAGATIHAFSPSRRRASIGAGCEVGPFARLRPGRRPAREEPRSAISARSRRPRSATAPRSTT